MLTTRGEALQSAIQYISGRAGAYDPGITVDQVIVIPPAHLYRASTARCWYVRVPPKQPRVGSDHYVCVSKRTGRVLYEGAAGE